MDDSSPKVVPFRRAAAKARSVQEEDSYSCIFQEDHPAYTAHPYDFVWLSDVMYNPETLLKELENYGEPLSVWDDDTERHIGFVFVCLESDEYPKDANQREFGDDTAPALIQVQTQKAHAKDILFFAAGEVEDDPESVYSLGYCSAKATLSVMDFLRGRGYQDFSCPRVPDPFAESAAPERR